MTGPPMAEESFQSGKGLTGLDDHPVRCYTSRQRWTVLVMLAHALLAVAVVEQTNQPSNQDMIR